MGEREGLLFLVRRGGGGGGWSGLGGFLGGGLEVEVFEAVVVDEVLGYGFLARADALEGC